MPHYQAIDHYVDIVLQVLVKLYIFGKIVHAAVHPYTDKSGAARVRQNLFVHALFTGDDRREHQKPGALRQC